MKIDDTTTRNNMADEIDASLSTTAYGRFQNASQTATYAKVPLANPAFGTAATGKITLDVTPTPEDTSPSAGTAVRLGFYTAKTGGTLIFTCGIATGGSPDVTMADNTIETTDTVQLTSLVVEVPSGTPDVT
jgi:hypothetical protein